MLDGVAWGEVVARLGLVAVRPVDDGIVYATRLAGATVELYDRCFVEPRAVRILVRCPAPEGGGFLIAPVSRTLGESRRWRTGDEAFDKAVVILSGGRTLLPRLGPTEREQALELVGRRGAVIGAEESSLEPAVTAGLVDTIGAVTLIRDLARLASTLSSEPSMAELVRRWTEPEPAPGVAAAVSRRVVERVPHLEEADADAVCRAVLQKGPDTALSLLSVMPAHPAVLAAWFEIGDPLDPRVLARVVEAFKADSPGPAARYLAWLHTRSSPEAVAVASRLWATEGLRAHAGFLREWLRLIKHEPPPAALPMLLEVTPTNGSIGRRVARALSTFPTSVVDQHLLGWLGSSSSGVRHAAATTLAQRAASVLRAGRKEPPDGIRKAAERSRELVGALLDEIPPEHTAWLVPLRPHGEADALALIQRLAQGGADADDALLFWLDRGTLQVRLEAARALGEVGTGRVVVPLRERAASWFGDAAVRDACRAALERLRRRGGGRGALALAEAVGGELSPTEPDGRLSPARRDS